MTLDTTGSDQITPDMLCRIGTALYGPTWQSEMARQLGLGRGGQGDSARIRQILTGRRRLPAGVAVELLAILRQRQADVAAIIKEVQATAGDQVG